MKRSNYYSIVNALSSCRRSILWALLLTGFFVMSAAAPAAAADADVKRVLSSWRSDGHAYSIGKDLDFYTGTMKGTFFVKDHTGPGHYMHASRMTCPFSVQINRAKKEDVLQGVCELVNEKGDRAFARISCSGDKNNCSGKWKFTSGSGRLKGIEGESSLKLRVDILKVESTEKGTFGRDHEASGYLIIDDLHDNVVDKGGFPTVR